MAGVPRNTEPTGGAQQTLETTPGAAMGQPRNGDSNRDAWADTSREANPSTRRRSVAASIPCDMTSMSQGEEAGEGEITMFDGEGNPYSVHKPRDPWGINRPIGGYPNPNAGLPR